MKLVELTEQEVAGNRELLNIAVKAGGLPLAMAAARARPKISRGKGCSSA